MSDNQREPSATHELARLAPNVGRAWAEELVLELRLADVPGARIGDILATVDAHVRDSGESAEEAFGDARGYAEELTAGGSLAQRPRWALTVVATVLGLAGMLTTFRAITPLLDREDIQVTGGDVGVTVVVALLMGVVLAAPKHVLGLIGRHPWRTVLIPMVVIAAMVAILLLAQDSLFTLPSGPTMVTGAVLLVLSALISWFDHAQDPRIIAPGDPRATNGTAPWPTRLGSALILPGTTVVVLGVLWMAHQWM